MYVLHGPRPINYISKSLDSYYYEWDHPITVLAEPGTFRFRGKCEIRLNPVRLGTVFNWLQAINMPHNCEWLGVFEDDIIWIKGSGPEVRKILHNCCSDIGIVSPYCCVLNAPERRGWQMSKIKKSTSFYGACALFLRKQLVAVIRENIPEFLSFTMRNEKHIDLDTAIGSFALKYGFKILTHNPSLIIHMGEISTNGKISDKPSRMAKLW